MKFLSVLKDKFLDRSAGTAISRRTISAPVKWLQNHGLLNGRILDYGSGRGFDADALKADRYDPYWHPIRPNGKFDTIICNYVLNVVNEETQMNIIKDIQALLKKGGVAYISVRRDLKGKTRKVNRSIQRWVELDFPSIHKTGDYEIYKVEK
jgi:hypothetical protein